MRLSAALCICRLHSSSCELMLGLMVYIPCQQASRSWTYGSIFWQRMAGQTRQACSFETESRLICVVQHRQGRSTLQAHTTRGRAKHGSFNERQASPGFEPSQRPIWTAPQSTVTTAEVFDMRQRTSEGRAEQPQVLVTSGPSFPVSHCLIACKTCWIAQSQDPELFQTTWALPGICPLADRIGALHVCEQDAEGGAAAGDQSTAWWVSGTLQPRVGSTYTSYINAEWASSELKSMMPVAEMSLLQGLKTRCAWLPCRYDSRIRAKLSGTTTNCSSATSCDVYRRASVGD